MMLILSHILYSTRVEQTLKQQVIAFTTSKAISADRR